MNNNEQLNGSVVPLNYRLKSYANICAPYASKGNTTRNVTQFQIDQLMKYDADAALFIVDRGQQFYNQWHDYLVGCYCLFIISILYL